MRTAILGLTAALSLAAASRAGAADIDWTKVDAALGKTASVQGEVHRYGFPRSDLQVTLDGVAIKPALALGGWLGFEPMRDGALVMGDLVLTETEVNPVMSKLLGSGIEITGLHNHLLRANPLPFYMHFMGMAIRSPWLQPFAQRLARARRRLARQRHRFSQVAQVDLDTAALDAAIGVKGKVNGGVYHFSVPRKDPVTEDGMSVPPAMGIAIVINFQPTGGGKAAMAGALVVTAEEVNPMILAEREWHQGDGHPTATCSTSSRGSSSFISGPTTMRSSWQLGSGKLYSTKWQLQKG